MIQKKMQGGEGKRRRKIGTVHPVDGVANNGCMQQGWICGVQKRPLWRPKTHNTNAEPWVMSG
ncbi:hypothetical protein M3J09_002799 [Ascochyta lentis]